MQFLLYLNDEMQTPIYVIGITVSIIIELFHNNLLAIEFAGLRNFFFVPKK